MTPLRGFGRAWDRITIYLPVILMGLLALGTYWLARNTPTFSPSAPDRAPTHEPDYFMRGFSVKSFDPGGRLKTEIVGVEARHFADSDTLEIDEPRIRSFNQEGALVTASARRGISNGDGSQVQLLGGAIVTRVAPPARRDAEAPLEIRSEFLQASMDEERVSSNQRVRLTRGADVFEGDGLDYDNQKRVLQLTGKVRGVLLPRPAAQPQPRPGPQ